MVLRSIGFLKLCGISRLNDNRIFQFKKKKNIERLALASEGFLNEDTSLFIQRYIVHSNYFHLKTREL